MGVVLYWGMRRPWTAQDLEQLTALYGAGARPRDIADRLGRSLAAVKTRASEYRITQQEARWSAADDLVVQRLCHLPWKHAAKELGRSSNAVHARAKILGIARRRSCRLCGSPSFHGGLCRSCHDRQTLGGRFARSKAVTSGGVTVAYLEKLFKDQEGRCAYTGFRMELVLGDYCVSTDRIDSSIPYRPGNVVLCCLYANIMKNDRSSEVFRRWCRAVASHR
jgi:hypothetical protein